MITDWRLPCLSNHGIAWLDSNEGAPVADEFLQLVGRVEVVKRFEAGLKGVWVWLRLAHGASHPCGGTGAPVTRVPIQAGA